MIQGSQFNLSSVSENSILTILKLTQVSKATGLEILSGHFLKDEAKFFAKPISDLCNLSINSKKFPGICNVAKLKPLYKKGSLTQPCNYRPLSLLPLIYVFVTLNIQSYRKSHSRSNKYLSEFKKFIIHLPIWFSKKHYLNDKFLKGFDKGLMTGMIFKRPLTQLFMTYFCKNYIPLVSRNIL